MKNTESTESPNLRLRKLPWITIVIAAMSLSAFGLPNLSTALQYDRTALAGGQVWRLATCHVTHFNFDHLAWDLGVFTLLGAICEYRNRRAFLTCIGLSAAVISLGVLWLTPRMDTYRGLSGIDTALFTLLGVWLLKSAIERRQWLGASIVGALMAAAVAKVCFELATGNTLFVNDVAAGFTPLPLAHILGAAAGLFAAVTPRRGVWAFLPAKFAPANIANR